MDPLTFGKYKDSKDVPLYYIIWLSGYWHHGLRITCAKTEKANRWVQVNHPKVVEQATEYVKDKCWKCGGKLVPIGHSRVNGADHDDWATRKFHKQCWKELKGAEGEYQSCSDY